MEIFILPSEFSGDPQSTAMLQAFYSRSIHPIKSRLADMGMDVSKVRKALKTYYVGYGHNSIADCGTVTLFVEGVSIVAAKALQEDPLYNGQECSTRYIRLSGELYPSTGPYSGEWMNIQRDVLSKLQVGVRQMHPYGDGKEVVIPVGPEYRQWENATAARAFDIARAWIPIAAVTNLSVHMTLRKLNELTARLLGHPLPEVQGIAAEIRHQMVQAYPDACTEFTAKEIAYANWLKQDLSMWYLNANGAIAPAIRATRLDDQGQLADLAIGVFTEMKLSPKDALFINSRPRHAPLPQHFQSKAVFTLNGFMDYATWRDLQRHRRQIGAPPMVTAEFGMHDWYYQQLLAYLHPDDASDLMARSEQLFRRVQEETDAADPLTQYCLPLGTNVPFEYKFGLSQAFYLAELRSGNTVHAILRPYAQKVAGALENYGLRVDYDSEPARFDLKRGSQTIVQNV